VPAGEPVPGADRAPARALTMLMAVRRARQGKDSHGDHAGL